MFLFSPLFSTITGRKRMKIVWIGLALIGLLPTCYAQKKMTGNDQGRPNILLIIADDWGLHAGVYSDKTARTPVFDSLAKHSALFHKAFAAAPSCTPSRAAILTGKYPHQLEAGANLWSYLPRKFTVYPELLLKAGYKVGYAEKGWGPGAAFEPAFKAHPAGYPENPAGPRFRNFATFLDSLPDSQPFCFWLGTKEPHRPFKKGIVKENGYTDKDLHVPSFLPATAGVKQDLLDYYYYVEQFDKKIGAALAELQRRELLQNTLIIITSDNGMPFDRAKTNVYDHGTNVPLLLYWKGRIAAKHYRNELVNLIDLNATILNAAGLKGNEKTSTNILQRLEAKSGFSDAVFLEREVHSATDTANQIPPEGLLSYPMRAVRTKRFLYIKNLRPSRYPQASFGLKQMLARFPDNEALIRAAFDIRPPEELYDVQADPFQQKNLAGNAVYQAILKWHRKQLAAWQRDTGDPRFFSDDDRWDKYPLFRNEIIQKR